MIFAVFDMLLAVTLLNYGILHLYLQFYYIRKYLKFKKQVTYSTQLGLFNK